MDNNKKNAKAPINTKGIMSMDELKEEFFKSLAVCEGCDHKLGCPAYPRAAVIGAFLDADDEGEEDPLLKSVYDDEDEVEEPCKDSDDEAEEYEIPAVPPHLPPIRELIELDAAVDALVDSLFTVEDKISNARQFLDKLDTRVAVMLEILEQLDIPQLSEE